MDGKLISNRYEIREQLGAGGMAEVFLAFDTKLDRNVAVKIMLPSFAGDDSFAMRFKNEAKAIAKLSSPFVAGVYDWGQQNDRFYIVMEFVPGTDLKHLLAEQGPLDPQQAVQIAMQVCLALEDAHAHQVIHKDVKPANIMVKPSGDVKLMDFGISQLGERVADDKTELVVGTAHYMSPEQMRGQSVEPASDLFSLGVVLYEMCVGHVPFADDTMARVIERQINDVPVDPAQLNPNVSADLNDIIMRAMVKSPQGRFASAAEFREALATCDLEEASSKEHDIPATIFCAEPEVEKAIPPTVSDSMPTPTSSESAASKAFVSGVTKELASSSDAGMRSASNYVEQQESGARWPKTIIDQDHPANSEVERRASNLVVSTDGSDYVGSTKASAGAPDPSLLTSTIEAGQPSPKRKSGLVIAGVAVAIALVVCVGLSLGGTTSTATVTKSGNVAPVQAQSAVEETWFGSIERSSAGIILKDISGIEGIYRDERGGAAKKHGYYPHFKLSEAKVNDDGKTGTCKLEMRWIPETNRPINDGVLQIDAIMTITFEEGELGTLYCSAGERGDSFWGRAKVTKKKFDWLRGQMTPGYTDDPDHQIDLSKSFTHEL